MKANSIKYCVDLELYNKLIDLFNLERKTPVLPWLCPTEDYGKWANLNLRDFYSLMTDSEDAMVIRTISLFAWMFELDLPEFMARSLLFLSHSDELDVIISAAIYNSSRCNKECHELFYEEFSAGLKDTALDYVLAIHALHGDIELFNCVKLSELCIQKIQEERLSIHDSFEVFCGLAMLYDIMGEDSPVLCESLHKLIVSVPNKNTNSVQMCEYHGISYRDCLLFSFLSQDLVTGKGIKNSPIRYETLCKRLIHEEMIKFDKWDEYDKRAIRTAIGSCDVERLVIRNNENFLWLKDEVGCITDFLIFSFRIKGWKEQYLQLSEEDRRKVMRHSLEANNDEEILILAEKNERVIKDAFSSFDPDSVPIFNRLVSLRIFKRVSYRGDELLYWASLFNLWDSHKSFDFLMKCSKKFSVLDRPIDLLLQGVLTVDFDFLSSDEKSQMFSVLDDYVFRKNARDYLTLLETCRRCVPEAQRIFNEYRGGDADE